MRTSKLSTKDLIGAALAALAALGALMALPRPEPHLDVDCAHVSRGSVSAYWSGRRAQCERVAPATAP